MIENREMGKLWKRRLTQWTACSREKLRLGLSVLAGMGLSAAALGGSFQPLTLGLLCAAPPGRETLLLAAGGACGYVLFWGAKGLQGAAWMALGLLAGWFGSREKACRRKELLIPALAALTVSAAGVWFQLRFGDETPVRMYLLRVGMAAFSAAVFSRWLEKREGWSRWAVQAFCVLALSRLSPVRYLNLGCAAAGLLGAAGNFPSAVLSGLALDLAGITAVRMTGALCIGWCLRKIPGGAVWWGCLSPGIGYLLMATLGTGWDIRPLPALLLGGAVAGMVPETETRMEVRTRTGEAALAQVRLERMALALEEMGRMLEDIPEGPIDEEAIWLRACSEACDTCPERKNCRARPAVQQLSPSLLHEIGLGEGDLPAGCRKSTRMLSSLRRGQEQLRRIRGERSRIACCREATREQYGFLSEFLREISDDLAIRGEFRPDRFVPEVAVAGRGAEAQSGDCCICFAGTGNLHYVLLCDGMGTGEAAARESRTAAGLLRQMLCAGFPVRSALRSLNSLAVLRSMGGCTTVDLLQLRLDTGRATLYKWGAVRSWLIRGGQLQPVGEVTPPPGVSRSCRECGESLSLSRGELLVLCSDGIEEGALLQLPTGSSPGELAAWILAHSAPGRDDATAAVVQLRSV